MTKHRGWRHRWRCRHCGRIVRPRLPPTIGRYWTCAACGTPIPLVRYTRAENLRWYAEQTLRWRVLAGGA